MPADKPLLNGISVDLAGERLRAGDGTTIDLRPQAFAMLRYLIAHANRLVTKDELVAAIWHGAPVTDDSLVQCIHEIRRALGDADRACLQTVSRRGYRLVLPEPAAAAEGPGASIAVLPFRSLGDDGLDYFAKGLAEDVIASLSPFPSLLVIARGASFAGRGSETDFRSIAAELGVRYLLGGSLRRAAARLRIAAYVVDGANGRQVWSGRFEGRAADVFDLQDRLTEQIIGIVEPTVRRAEIERARRRRPGSLDAYDLYLQALPHAFANTAAGGDEALRLLEAALARDPGYLAAHACAAWCHEQRYLRRGFDPADRDAALAHVAHTTGANADDALAMSMGAFVQGMLTRDYDRASDLLDRALVLNGNSALSYGFSALVAAHGERHARARAHAERALRLSPPDDPLNYHPYCALTIVSLFAGRHDEAAAYASLASRANPVFSVPYTYLVAAKVGLGDMTGARQAAARLLEAEPRFTVRGFARMDIFPPEFSDGLVHALRRAGLPEGSDEAP